MRFYIIILILLCTSFSLAARNLFSPNESSKIVATKNKDNSLGCSFQRRFIKTLF